MTRTNRSITREPYRSATTIMQRKLFSDIALLNEARAEGDEITAQIARNALREDRKRLSAIKQAHDTGTFNYTQE